MLFVFQLIWTIRKKKWKQWEFPGDKIMTEMMQLIYKDFTFPFESLNSMVYYNYSCNYGVFWVDPT